MVKKRKLSPKSLWDEAELRVAFQEAGVKESHIRKLYRCLVLCFMSAKEIDHASQEVENCLLLIFECI